MKKSLIKSLLPVLVVALVLSLATISVMADAVKGYYYCPEKEGCTYYIELFDGLGRSKTALDAEESAGTYDGLGVDGEALEAAADAGIYDGLGVDGEALEAVACATYDGLGVDGEALEAAAASENWDGFHIYVGAECDDEVADDLDGNA